MRRVTYVPSVCWFFLILIRSLYSCADLHMASYNLMVHFYHSLPTLGSEEIINGLTSQVVSELQAFFCNLTARREKTPVAEWAGGWMLKPTQRETLGCFDLWWFRRGCWSPMSSCWLLSLKADFLSSHTSSLLIVWFVWDCACVLKVVRFINMTWVAFQWRSWNRVFYLGALAPSSQRSIGHLMITERTFSPSLKYL